LSSGQMDVPFPAARVAASDEAAGPGSQSPGVDVACGPAFASTQDASQTAEFLPDMHLSAVFGNMREVSTGDEAGGRLASFEAFSSDVGGTLPTDIAGHERHLQQLFMEPCEALLVQHSPMGSLVSSRSPRASHSETTLLEDWGMEAHVGEPRRTTSTIKNLDTGEVRDLLSEALTVSFVGDAQVPRELSLAASDSAAWKSWWQDHHECKGELLRASEEGDTETLSRLLGLPLLGEEASFASCNNDISGEVSTEPQACIHLGSRTPGGSHSALHVAAAAGHSVCIELLLRAGSGPTVVTNTGLTPLHVACLHGHAGVARKLLVATGTGDLQTEPVDQHGETSLHLAAARGHAEVVELLLESGIPGSINVRNNFGQLPSEVCLNVATAECFRRYRRLTGAPMDSYAMRTPFTESTLLRNSRADNVRRLLHGKTASASSSGLPAVGSSDFAATELVVGDGKSSSSTVRSPARSPVRSPPSGTSTVRRRSSFSKMRVQEGVENVGPEDFRLRSVLGKGSFGEVYEVVHRGNGQVYAMKVLRKNRVFARNLQRYVMTERNLLSYIRHPFIVRLHYAFQTPKLLVMVLQYCSNGSLAALVQREGSLHEPLARLYTAEIFLAIEHLHERNVVYRDMKPENIVLDDDNHAMLTDFGLSKEGVEGLHGTRSFCGSVAYLAPEILNRSGHGPPVDLYGIGVLLYEMLTGRPPFYNRDKERLYHNIKHAPLELPSSASRRAGDLIASLMRRNPAQRLGARKTSEVRHHPFFAGLSWDAILRREVPALTWSRRFSPNNQSSSGDMSPGDVARVASPFEGRIEAQVRRLSGNSSQEVTGWEFASPVQLPASPLASPPATPMLRASLPSIQAAAALALTEDVVLAPAYSPSLPRNATAGADGGFGRRRRGDRRRRLCQIARSAARSMATFGGVAAQTHRTHRQQQAAIVDRSKRR